MVINSIIIDDELNNIENFQYLIERYFPDIKVLASSMNADDAIEKINQLKPDLVFLDIQMPGKSGFEVLKAFQKVFFEVIFITAYDKYGIEAIKFSALDYLLKPVIIDELKVAVEKAKTRISEKKQNLKIENLLEFIRNDRKEHPKIALPALTEIIYVNTNEIIHCEADNNYTMFFLESGEKILVCKSLKEYSDMLKPFGFIRTHQSHLVNIQFVRSFLKEDGGKLLLRNQLKIPISRQNRNDVKKALE